MAADRAVDLRREPLAGLRAIDFRAPDRDYWADEAEISDRFVASWAGLDDAAWRLPGAAPSDAGGPDWSLLDHVAHVVDWHELATDYIAKVIDGAEWPSDDDYSAGDFDTFNESRRPLFADIAPADLRRRAQRARSGVLAVAHRLPARTIRTDAAWGWVHQVLHGHELDHLAVVEPWTDALRQRQARNDPFGLDPQPVHGNLPEALERFWTDEASILELFGTTIDALPDANWTRPTDGDWTVADHVAHLAGWFEIAVDALRQHAAGGGWMELPAEGLDVFNDRQVRSARGTAPAALRRRYETGLAALRGAVRAMTEEEWLDPEGFSWAYEDLHGHVRIHLAMIAPWAARAGWPVGERR
ncbi:MAG TPA: maleylpyruvate isomerase N-terminal domain-containing protein [Candidatus Limnocylindrales bacterium]|nr:maleylpyruvate isomerase N-terminal domain-containing protein [Candidatus Limnocylindrales bacterium]